MISKAPPVGGHRVLIVTTALSALFLEHKTDWQVDSMDVIWLKYFSRQLFWSINYCS